MIGMQASIGSQMTADEALEYLDKVLERAGLARGVTGGDPLALQLRAGLIGTVVSVLGRPIAKAEQAAIAKAEKQFDEMAKDSNLRPVGRLVPDAQRDPDSPFRNEASKRANPLPPAGS